jgi:hypothetical protein
MGQTMIYSHPPTGVAGAAPALTFGCQHFSMTGVTAARCVACGLLLSDAQLHLLGYYR